MGINVKSVDIRKLVYKDSDHTQKNADKEYATRWARHPKGENE